MKKKSIKQNTKKTAAKIQAVVFDFGDVIIRDNELVLEKKYNFDKIPKKQQEKYKEALHLVETAKISTKEFAKVCKEVLGYKQPAEYFNETIIKAPLIKPVWNLIKDLKKRTAIAILTNNKKNYPQKSAKYLGISLKGVKIFNSADIGVRKPDPKIYKFALRKLGVKPAETVFIDDRVRNINGARDVGMNTILFDGNYKKLVTALKKLGVEVRI